MKNKGLTYGLIVVVAIVWYQVFVRVKSNFTTEDALPTTSARAITSRRIARPESFSLQANYRDPFSGSMDVNVSQPPPANPSQGQLEPKPPKPQPIPVAWPAIRYYGLVRKTTAAQALALISIDGTYYKLHQGDEVLDNLRVKSVTRDSVLIGYRKQVRIFQKSGR